MPPIPVRPWIAPAALEAAEALWQRQQAANAANYAPGPDGAFPTHSCSVDGHAGAEAFRAFLVGSQASRKGPLLDIGCGPQPVPAYLEGLPAAWITGIDPLPPSGGPHPFTFVQGYAEHLPWPDGHFARVVAATSLDHLIDPAAAVAEARRVLRPEGRFCVWATFWPEAPPYDPRNPPADLTTDGLHAYHLGPWFWAVLMRYFRPVREQINPANPNDVFLELAPRTVGG